MARAELIYGVKTSAKIVALTFDDGPNPAATLAIAKILKSRHIPATFFEVGRSIQRHPEITKALAAEGFSIGNHSWDHPAHISWISGYQVQWEIERTSRLIANLTGQRPKYFRPPHGSWTNNLIARAQRQGLKTVLWSVDPGDWKTNNPKLITASVDNWTIPGAIIILHDGLQDGTTANVYHDRTGVLAALPMIIKRLSAAGYRFVSLDDLFSSGISMSPLGHRVQPDNKPQLASWSHLGQL